MYSISEIYKRQIDFNVAKSPYINHFLGNPYSYLKARYYMYFGSVLVYLLQETSVNPNTITKLYIFSGFLAAILLAVPNYVCNYIALFMIFSKGILDWTDGQLARIKGMTSLTGHILDVYGARIHSLTFILGLGIYQYFHLDGNELFLAALFIYPFCFGTLLTKFSNQYVLDDISPEKFNKHIFIEKQKQWADPLKTKYKKYLNFFTWFLDDRSRTIDFVCLLILLEQFGFYSLSWLFFVGVSAKWVVLWLGSFYISSRSKHADKIVNAKINDLKNV